MADYLSREEILQVFDNLTVKNPDDKYQHGMQDTIDCLIPEVINGMEAKDVQPLKHGYWKDIMMSEATGWDLSLTGGRDEVLETVCSVCGDCCAFGGDGDLYLSNYCPNCGARMLED